ncbi:hypothetical protein D9758_012118 [Tetrapyrgos nigripes]|uniref:F-box domain-containing protein n=1 Tax=Tetrapyrgos nigripes TaxID=182062 RepID=A0A8H5CLD7_9AGAR|nr:hypothetical protein D9758_012118 [Tetrapyrgos nigripes]
METPSLPRARRRQRELEDDGSQPGPFTAKKRRSQTPDSSTGSAIPIPHTTSSPSPRLFPPPELQHADCYEPKNRFYHPPRQRVPVPTVGANGPIQAPASNPGRPNRPLRGRPRLVIKPVRNSRGVRRSQATEKYKEKIARERAAQQAAQIFRRKPLEIKRKQEMEAILGAQKLVMVDKAHAIYRNLAKPENEGGYGFKSAHEFFDSERPEKPRSVTFYDIICRTKTKSTGPSVEESSAFDQTRRDLVTDLAVITGKLHHSARNPSILGVLVECRDAYDIYEKFQSRTWSRRRASSFRTVTTENPTDRDTSCRPIHSRALLHTTVSIGLFCPLIICQMNPSTTLGRSVTSADRLQLEDMNQIFNMLRSNHTVPCSGISQCLAAAERDIQGVLDQIHQLEKRIFTLKDDMRGLEWRTFRYRSLLSPARRLPAELLSYIFEAASEDGAIIGATMRSTPAHISQVCAYWRTLARRTPKLWSSLDICPQPSHTVEQIKPLLTMHLELSKPSPLYLTVDMKSGDSRHPTNEVASYVLQNLVLHCDRWKEARLRGLKGFEQNLSAIKGQLPSLRTLSLKTDFAPDFDALELIPKLQQLRSHGSSTTALPWKQVAIYQAERMNPSDVLQELSNASNATEVVLTRCYLKRPPESHLVHHLHSLTIFINSSRPNFSPWFQWLTLPNLTRLDIMADKKQAPTSCNSVFLDDCFPSFLMRSSCTITSLTLRNLPLSDVDVLAILSALPSLSTLEIKERDTEPSSNTMLTTHFFESLTIDHGQTFSNRRSPSLQLKRLQFLDLRLHATLPAQCIVELIESRWTDDPQYSAVLGINNLSEVEILVVRSEDATTLDVQELRDLMKVKDMGMRFSCSSKFLKAKKT